MINTKIFETQEEKEYVEKLCKSAYETGFLQWRKMQKDEGTTSFEEWKKDNLK